MKGHRLDQSGVLTRVAGNTRGGYSGDGGPAISAQLAQPYGVAVDSAGNLYIADYGNGSVRLLQPIASSLTHTSVANAASNLAGTSVSFNGTPAPIVYSSSTQVAAIVPYAVSGSSAQVAVTVTLGGQALSPQYAGGAPGLVAGLMQVSVQIPVGLVTGSATAVPVAMKVGKNSSQHIPIQK